MSTLNLFLSHIHRHCRKICYHRVDRLIHSSPLTSTSNVEKSHLYNNVLVSVSVSSRFLFLGFSKSFSSSSSSSNTQSEGKTNESNRSTTIKPVSYVVKSEKMQEEKDNSSTIKTNEQDNKVQEDDSGKQNSTEPRSWTRDDIRYMKESSIVKPVSYPSRVAPLPEDRVLTSVEESLKEAKQKDEEQWALEREKIEKERRIRRILQAEEEKLPFPTIIKVEKKKPKVVIDLVEAIREVKGNAKRNFLETVEAHVNLGVDPRRGDQMVRGATTLPHGTGKVVRVAVFADGAAAAEAREAGADVVGGEELVEEIKKGGGKLNFDKCISTPAFMPRLGKIARILGPRGLMPNPKLGSLTNDVSEAVKEAKRGRIDFKIDKTAIVHVGLGKVNFSEEALRENVGAFMNALLVAKPVGLKKTSKYSGYVNSFTLSSTMGPGFPVTIQSLSIAADHYLRLQQLK